MQAILPDLWDRLFSESGRILEGVNVIYTSGHTPGSTCFQVAGQEGLSDLFTGDALYRVKSRHWRPGMIEGVSNRA